MTTYIIFFIMHSLWYQTTYQTNFGRRHFKLITNCHVWWDTLFIVNYIIMGNHSLVLFQNPLICALGENLLWRIFFHGLVWIFLICLVWIFLICLVWRIFQELAWVFFKCLVWFLFQGLVCSFLKCSVWFPLPDLCDRGQGSMFLTHFLNIFQTVGSDMHVVPPPLGRHLGLMAAILKDLKV